MYIFYNLLWLYETIHIITWYDLLICKDSRAPALFTQGFYFPCLVDPMHDSYFHRLLAPQVSQLCLGPWNLNMPSYSFYISFPQGGLTFCIATGLRSPKSFRLLQSKSWRWNRLKTFGQRVERDSMLFLKAEMTSECWHSIGPIAYGYILLTSSLCTLVFLPNQTLAQSASKCLK